VLTVVATLWSFVLDFTTTIPKLQMAVFPPVGPPSDGQRATLDVYFTLINLLPVYFVLAPLTMEIGVVVQWLSAPWTMPGPEDGAEVSTCSRLFWRPVRWLLF
jgi:hypothetical protein